MGPTTLEVDEARWPAHAVPMKTRTSTNGEVYIYFQPFNGERPPQPIPISIFPDGVACTAACEGIALVSPISAPPEKPMSSHLPVFPFQTGTDFIPKVVRDPNQGPIIGQRDFLRPNTQVSSTIPHRASDS